MDSEIKNLVNQMKVMAKKVGEMHGVADFDKEVIDDLSKFMMYLSASDGIIVPDEAAAISEILGVSITPEDVKKFISENKIYTEQFERTVPDTMKKLVSADNEMSNMEIEHGQDSSEILMAIYKSIGEELIGSDGDVDISEKTDLYIYLTTLDKYLDNNLISRGKVDYKMDRTVKAPAKR